MPVYLTPVMLAVPVVLRMSEICGYPVHIYKIDMYSCNIFIYDNMVVNVKEPQQIISTMPVVKACGSDHVM